MAEPIRGEETKLRGAVAKISKICIELTLPPARVRPPCRAPRLNVGSPASRETECMQAPVAPVTLRHRRLGVTTD